jgi:hypothetical protein
MGILTGIYAKLIGALLVLVALLGLWLWGHHVGAASVQAKWDVANAKQSIIAVKASEAARSIENRQANDFAGIATNYLQATNHAYPSLADALPSAVSSGTLQLRDRCPATSSPSVSEAAARSRAADAASTQALADRVTAAIEIVSIGDAADARERQLGAQIVALQEVLKAERH